MSAGNYVGEVCDEPYRAVCSYAPTPADPICGAPATTHILGETPHHGLVALVACDDHVAAAKASAHVLGEHVHAGFCSFPGALWTEDRCVLDGSGPHRELTATAPILEGATS